MANSLSAYTPTIISKTLRILRERLRIQQCVTTDYDSELAAIGSSIQIPVTAQLIAGDVTPASTPPALTSISPTSVTLTLNKFKRAPFSVTTSDLNTMMRSTDFVPAHLQEACRSIARQIVDDVWQNFLNVPYYVGTAATNPFATSLATLSLAAKSMDDTLADTDQRWMLVSNAAKEKALELGNLIQAFQRGDASTLNSGELGNLLGFTMARDTRVPTFTAGGVTGAVVNNVVANPVGSTTVPVDLGTGTILAGDIFTVAGDTQTYVVTVGGASAGSTITFYPPSLVAWADETAITFKATHVVNLGLDRGAFALGMRQPRQTDGMLNTVYPMIDNQGREATGMQFFLSMVPNYWGVTYEIGAFYGTTTLRPERAVRMAG